MIKIDKETGVEWVIIILGLPIWVIMVSYEFIKMKITVRKYLRGETEEVWKRCSNLWQQSNRVYGEEVGYNFSTRLEHKLAVEFVKYQPNSKKFLLSKLSDPDACLAAYAFKALIRHKDFSKADIHFSVFERNDEIIAFMFGCVGEKFSLGDWVNRYFVSHL